MKSPTARNLSNLIQNQNSKYNFKNNFKRSDQKNKVKLFRNKGGIRKNPNKFGFFTQLDKFTSLSVSDTLFVNVFCKFSRSGKQINLLSLRLIEIL